MHCKTLVHKLGCQKPRTMHEFLEIATNHSSGKEAVGDIFEHDQHAAKEKRRDRDRPSSSREDRNKKKNRRPPTAGEVAVTKRQDKRPPRNVSKISVPGEAMHQPWLFGEPQVQGL